MDKMLIILKYIVVVGFCLAPLRSARGSATAVCEGGQVVTPVAGTTATICSDGVNYFGPITPEMESQCRASGSLDCDKRPWPLLNGMMLRGWADCPAGSWFDGSLGFCVDSDTVYGPFPPHLRDACAREGGGTSCQGTSWSKGFARDLINPSPPPARTPTPAPTPQGKTWGRLVQEIGSRVPTGSPTFQDAEGLGIWGERGRSEELVPPFVLGPRRQVDSMVRQLYLLLPAEVRRETAFVIPDRFVQNPEGYYNYLKSRRHWVIAASFVGVGDATNAQSSTLVKARARHERELWSLRKTIEAAQIMQRPVKDVVLGLGDSLTAYGNTVRGELQQRANALLGEFGLAPAVVAFGADELVALGMARQLPVIGIRVKFTNPHARHHWDGRNTTVDLINEKLRQAGAVVDDSNPRLEVVVFSRRPGAEDIYAHGDKAQKDFDSPMIESLRTRTSEEARKTVVIDARTYNGSWDARAFAGRCDLMAYGAWGTFGNMAGQTLATAKILLHAGRREAARQLLLEAVAHDAVAIGYEESRVLHARLAAQGISWKAYAGSANQGVVARVFSEMNGFVNQRMGQVFADASCFSGRSVRLTPQLWRTFESEIHLWPIGGGEVQAPGIYRRDLPAASFDPARGEMIHLDLRRLEAEGCCGQDV